MRQTPRTESIDNNKPDGKTVTTKHNDNVMHETDDDATDELPILICDEAGGNAANDECGETVPQNNGHAPGNRGVSFSLSFLETEVTRLHAKWMRIDAELKIREKRICELKNEIGKRDATTDRLMGEIEEAANAHQALADRLSSTEARIDELLAEQRSRDSAMQKRLAEAEGAETRCRILNADLEKSRAELREMRGVLDAERRAATEAAERSKELSAAKQALHGTVQDLEQYIDGRRKSWDELNAKLAGYQDALKDMEVVLHGKDIQAARQKKENETLALRISDLEKLCAELNGRRKERDDAYDDLQEKMVELVQAAEEQKSKISRQAQDAERALTEAVNKQKLIESLEHAVAERDKSVSELETELQEKAAIADELSKTGDEMKGRVQKLEDEMEERQALIETLRDELRAGNDQAKALRRQLSEKDAELACARETSNQSNDSIDKLRDQLSIADAEKEALRGELEAMEQRVAMLEPERETAMKEIEELLAELAEQQAVVSSLEQDLSGKQEMVDQLERNVQRLNELGESVAAVDREISTAAAAQDSKPPEIESHELLPLTALVTSADSDRVCIDIETRRNKKDGRKLVAIIDGERIDYPLDKEQMTIGRGKKSDIRIASHFISRTHARISAQHLATAIEDVGSKNGTLVNSERVTRMILRDGDVVSLGGKFDLTYVDDRP
jgi:chromosome segregation ATPase